MATDKSGESGGPERTEKALASERAAGEAETAIRGTLTGAEKSMGRVHRGIVTLVPSALQALAEAERDMGAAHTAAVSRARELESKYKKLQDYHIDSSERAAMLEHDVAVLEQRADELKEEVQKRNDTLLALLDWWRREGQYGDCPWCRESGSRPHYPGCPIGGLLELDREELVEVRDRAGLRRAA